MDLVAYIEETWTRQAEEFVSCAEFRSLENGTAAPDDYDRFVANVFRTHQNSPQFFGFLLMPSYTLFWGYFKVIYRSSLCDSMRRAGHPGCSLPGTFAWENAGKSIT